MPHFVCRIARMCAHFTFGLALLVIPTSARAGDQMEFKGKVFAYDGRLRGTITISTGGATVERHGAFMTKSASYSFAKMNSVRVERGWFHTWVRMNFDDDRAVTIRTTPGYYEGLRELLKTKL